MIYVGWLLYGVWGGLVVGFLFVLSGVVVIFVLLWIYVFYGNVGLVEVLFFGLKVVVFVIVV